MSVIIPTLNEAEEITTTIASAQEGKPHEILVVDGGSNDETVQRAREANATVINSAPGRARQINAGAARATGNVLLFLHADTLLPHDYLSAVSGAWCQRGVAAGAFRFRIAGNFAGKWIVEWTTKLRSRWGRGPTGINLERAVGTAKYANHAKTESIARNDRFTRRVNTFLRPTLSPFTYLAFFAV